MTLIAILIAWFVDMPLWLSILVTILASIRFSIKLAKLIGNIADL